MVHTHLIHGALYGNLAAKMAGVDKIICTKHDCSPYMENFFCRFLVRSSSGICNKIIVISKAIGDFVTQTENLPPERIHLIAYGLDLPDDTQSTSPEEFKHQLGIEDGATVMAAVGRLVTSKGHRTLIESLPIVLKAVGETTLLIAGSGPLEGDLKELARRLGVEKRIRFLGFLNNVYPLYRTIDLLVHPSLREGFGLTVLEAMGHDVPVIASRVTALPEIVEDDKTGILTPPQNPQALAEAIIRLLKNKLLRKKMGAAGCRRVAEYFPIDKMVRETEELYEEILLEKNKN
jgi:glycosyltransferase involved in cell wall biosynthesis